jgi:hypothetical protein
MKTVVTTADVDEEEWLRAAARNPVFRDLEAPEEDVYSQEDGDPFQDAGEPGGGPHLDEPKTPH